jgi:transketolase
MATQVRRRVLVMTSEAGAPHVASALSCVDILVALYFEVGRIDPAAPDRPERDRIIFSKGHAAAAFYATLAERGFFSTARLADYARDGSGMTKHPTRGQLPGIECTTGSLGHGLAIGAGLAMAARMDHRTNRVFVVLSDGECNEGSVWEAAMWAPARGLDNLVAIVDANGLQATGRSAQITSLEPLSDKWRSFGWDTIEVNGHDPSALVDAMTPGAAGRPRAVIARTVKGKGVSFMEDDLEWHYRPPTPRDLARALEELDNA